MFGVACRGLILGMGLWLLVMSFLEYFYALILGRISALEEVGFNSLGLFSECFFFDLFSLVFYGSD